MGYDNIERLVEDSIPDSENSNSRESSRRLKPPLLLCYQCKEEIPRNQGKYHKGKLYCPFCYAAAKADEPKAAEAN